MSSKSFLSVKAAEVSDKTEELLAVLCSLVELENRQSEGSASAAGRQRLGAALEAFEISCDLLHHGAASSIASDMRHIGEMVSKETEPAKASSIHEEKVCSILQSFTA